MSSEIRLVGGAVITQDAGRRVLPRGEVAWDAATGTISYVGEVRGEEASLLAASGREFYDGTQQGAPGDGGRVIDATGRVVIPGLVNAHTHSGMTSLRGYGEDLNLQDWLAAIWPFEGLLTAEDIRFSLRLAMAEMLRSGTTTFADMFLWDAGLLADVAAAGMRVLAAPAMFGAGPSGYRSAGAPTGTETLDITEQLAAEFAGDDHIRIAFGPHAPYTCTPDFLREVARRSQARGLPVQIHLSESRAEVESCRAEHGMTPIELAAALGLTAGPLLVAHGTHATEREIALLAEAGAAVSHNPVSNMKLGSGIAPIRAYRDAGVTLGLGTDSVASNNNLDLTEEIKTGILLQRAATENPTVVRSAELLDMATCEGARAVHFPEVGALEAGRPADVVLLDAGTPRAVPLHDPIAFVTYAAVGAADVRDVWIGGRQVVAAGRVTSIDEGEAREKVAAAAARITAELSTRSQP